VPCQFHGHYTEGQPTIVRREPIGVVGMITPWNWPINQFVVKVFPAFATGCTVVHKPSEIAPFTAHVLAEIFHESGSPAGIYSPVDDEGPTLRVAIPGHPGVDTTRRHAETLPGAPLALAAIARQHIVRVLQSALWTIEGPGGAAQPAIQEGKYVASVIRRRVLNLPPSAPFCYWNKGNLAIVGRTFAVADVPPFRYWGVRA
jgi:aldehyde dehydrogenase (NAD+)